MTIHHVFLFSASTATRRIREADAEILVSAKAAWAVLPSGQRRLLGSSAFYTLAAAERAKRGALGKIVETTALRRMPRTADLWDLANHQLERFKATGKFN